MSGTGKWTPRLHALPVEDWKADGSWQGMTIADRLDSLCERTPDMALTVDGDRILTANEMRRRALGLRAGLVGMGLGVDDVVSFQLPNWHEAALIDLACSYGGFVCNPIVPIYREAEVGHIIADAGSRVFVIPETFRGYDYSAMARRISDRSNQRFETLVVRAGPDTPQKRFEDMIRPDEGETVAPIRADGARADAIKLLMYTSGTTGRAKGVLHSHNTIGAEISNFIDYLGISGKDVVLMPSPLGHVTGYLYGVQLPVTAGCKVVLMDSWDVAAAADLIDQHGVTFTIGATPFLQELSAFAAGSGRSLPSLRYFASGGAPVPPEVVHRANAAFENCSVFRLYGSTEAPTVTLGVPERERANLAASTEGFVVGHDMRLVDLDGSEVAPGEEGEIVTRGPEVCLGYSDPSQNADVFDADGFFHTGDLGRLTPEGCLVITGRKKDLIIRGGENLGPKEIEDEIYKIAAVKDAAVVAMPHARLGETACAFVVLHDGNVLDLPSLVAFLEESGLARQKFPERLEVVPDLPYTAAGKVRKDLLRKRAAEFAPIGRARDEDSTEEKITR
ncbi:AMP-binding protein [Nitratireductor sp. CAU 1489]|uniref:AMP-binding protein n=1 Tax=Nitratireductor arenosus TaxID=2682096 RepID=A0A844QDD8_9HYPH|nr:AMP-binding protein [Nitratireductor arenosus]MVA96011.1 AMP-binding protein [Nitratireductor arenosus]